MQDIAQPLYGIVDHSRCVFAGSYSLQQYTRASWIPNDIDIPCKIASYEAFQQEIARLAIAYGKRVSIEKLEQVTPEMRLTKSAANGRDERFHESIMATCTMRFEGIPMPVQFIALDNSICKDDILAHLNEVADLPASVNYTVKDGKRIFNVPERCIDALVTRKIPAHLICASRRKKYEERGYEFI